MRKIKFDAFPNEVVEDGAVVQCLGAPLLDPKGAVIGKVIGYEIVDGKCLMEAQIEYE